MARSSAVGQSLDASRLGSKRGRTFDEHGATSVAFSTLSAKKPKNILPAIKMSNRAVLRDVLLSEEEASVLN